MTRRAIIYLIIILAVLGLGDSIYLAVKAATHSSLFCEIGAGLDGCNTVAQSPYSRPFGIPLAYLGVVFYALLLGAALAALWKHHQHFHRALLAVAGIGALFSVAFLYIQLALIEAVCIYCLASAAIAFLSLGLAFWLERRHAPVPAVLS